MRIRLRQHWRFLLWGGLVSPLLMALGGALLAWLRLGHVAWLGPVPWLRVAWAPVVAGASLGVTGLVARLWPTFGRRLKQSGDSSSLEALEQVGYPLLLMIVSVAALGEELLFRGGVQPWLGVIGAAVLFGFSHGGWRWREMWAYVLAAAFSGLLFGWFHTWSGTIWGPVLAHLCHNVTAVLFLGKKVEVSWEGGLPRVRLVPEVGGAPPIPAEDATSDMENEREA